MERAIANLSLNTLIRECSKNPQDAKKHYLFFDSVNRERIHEVFSYKKFNKLVEIIVFKVFPFFSSPSTMLIP